MQAVGRRSARGPCTAPARSTTRGRAAPTPGAGGPTSTRARRPPRRRPRRRRSARNSALSAVEPQVQRLAAHAERARATPSPRAPSEHERAPRRARRAPRSRVSASHVRGHARAHDDARRQQRARPRTQERPGRHDVRLRRGARRAGSRSAAATAWKISSSGAPASAASRSGPRVSSRLSRPSRSRCARGDGAMKKNEPRDRHAVRRRLGQRQRIAQAAAAPRCRSRGPSAMRALGMRQREATADRRRASRRPARAAAARAAAGPAASRRAARRRRARRRPARPPPARRARCRRRAAAARAGAGGEGRRLRRQESRPATRARAWPPTAPPARGRTAAARDRSVCGRPSSRIQPSTTFSETPNDSAIWMRFRYMVHDEDGRRAWYPPPDAIDAPCLTTMASSPSGEHDAASAARPISR